MSQYFDNDPNLGHADLKVEFELFGHKYELKSDIGVFSKNELDKGSRFLLETIGKMDLGKDILDLGCGAGPIGLILASLDPSRRVTLSDVNQRALRLSKENAESLGLCSRTEIIESDVYTNLSSTTYDTIVSNPPIRAGKKVTYRIYDEANEHLNEGGKLIIVIRKEQGAESVKKHLETLFPEVETLSRRKGYLVIQATKTRSKQ